MGELTKEEVKIYEGIIVSIILSSRRRFNTADLLDVEVNRG